MARSTGAHLIVAGGGASGLVCAVTAARLGMSTTLFEKTGRCGSKLAVTGSRKCNLTHATPPRAMSSRFEGGAERLHPLLRRYPWRRVVRFFESIGVPCRVEDDGRVWPADTDAAGVRDALVCAATGAGVRFRYRARIHRVIRSRRGWQVRATEARLSCSHLCLATGGASYPQTGSEGNGIGICRRLGLDTRDWYPALVSVTTSADTQPIAGTTHPHARLRLHVNGRPVASASGHFMVTKKYLSGTPSNELSGHASLALAQGRRAELRVDWLPDTSRSLLDRELRDGGRVHPLRRLTTFVGSRMSRRLAKWIVGRAAIPPDRVMSGLSPTERRRVIETLKSTGFELTGTEPLDRAIVSGGGVSLSEVDIETCQARLFPGIYIAGEMLDTWAGTGGYNLHLACASAIAAGESIAGRGTRVSTA